MKDDKLDKSLNMLGIILLFSEIKNSTNQFNKPTTLIT